MEDNNKPGPESRAEGSAGRGEPGDLPGWPGPGPSPGGPPGGWASPPGFPPHPSQVPRKSGTGHRGLIALIIALFLIAALMLIITAFTKGPAGPADFTPFSFGKRVGVVKVEGIIMDSREVVENLRGFLEDDSIAAVVVRVESPGGVVGAAQEIYSEVKKLSEEKPVVASFGSVAASGGYYLACPANKIFANPGTITGSIGVVMEVTNLEGLLEWLKIKNTAIKSGKFKDAGAYYRELTPEEKQYLQSVVDDLHLQFEKAVAQGRKTLSLEEVHKLADGRVFTGEQAKELGLVDELGTLWDAIEEAGKMGGIKGKPKVVWARKRRPSFLPGVVDSLLQTALQSPPDFYPFRGMYIMSLP